MGPSISDAERVISSPGFADIFAPTASAYSSRGGFHASSVGSPGSLHIESYQASQLVAACWTLGRSATAMFSAVSSGELCGADRAQQDGQLPSVRRSPDHGLHVTRRRIVDESGAGV